MYNGAAPRPTRLQHMLRRSGFAGRELQLVLLGPGSGPGLSLLCPSILPVVGMPVGLLLRSKNEGILSTMLAYPARPAVTAVLGTMPVSPTPRTQSGSSFQIRRYSPILQKTAELLIPLLAYDLMFSPEDCQIFELLSILIHR
jgi:hypothetical protein